MNGHVCLLKIIRSLLLHTYIWLCIYHFTPSKMTWILGWKTGNKLLHKLLKCLSPLTEANLSRKTNTVTDMAKEKCVLA